MLWNWNKNNIVYKYDKLFGSLVHNFTIGLNGKK